MSKHNRSRNFQCKYQVLLKNEHQNVFSHGQIQGCVKFFVIFPSKCLRFVLYHQTPVGAPLV